ncbi:MAG: histidine kinase [Ruminococcus sp.]|nr:histidine kinase [Ruminococcus sp.]
MIFDYFDQNFMAFMILLTLGAVMYVNKDIKIPASRLFMTGIFILLAVSLNDLMTEVTERLYESGREKPAIVLRTWADTICYTLRPCIIMIELFIVIPNKKYRLLCSLPAAVNGVIFGTALFGSGIAFRISDTNTFCSGPLHLSIYLTQILYVTLLLCFSIISFKKNNRRKSLMLVTIFIQAVLAAVREFYDLPPSMTNAVTALCMLNYYIYLFMIERQTIADSLIQKELDLTKSELTVLRNQIQPHFIYNVLTMIRSLTRTDTERAVTAINNFSKYLKTHIKAIQSEDMIPFEDELKNVSVYVELAQTDYPGKIELIYDLKENGFYIPALSLEPIIENAIQHGISRQGGRITVSTMSENGETVIRITDNGTAKKEMTQKVSERLGVGLDNTRKRLSKQCGGKMDVNVTDSGCTVTIRIPETRRG